MEKITINKDILTQLCNKTTFRDNGDVDYANSVACLDDNGNVVAAILVGNITNYPTLGDSIPTNVSDEKGSAQMLLLYMDNETSYGFLYELMRDFLNSLLPFKIFWCFAGEYTPAPTLSRLGFSRHIKGVSEIYYMMAN